MQPAQSPQRVDLDANHPVILDLKKETANAKDEAALARKGEMFSNRHSDVVIDLNAIILYNLYNRVGAAETARVPRPQAQYC